MNDSSRGHAPPRAAARAVSPRLDARGRRGDAGHHLHRVAADRGAGPGGGHAADRAGRAAGTADPGRAPAGRARRHHPGRGRGRPPRPGPGGPAGRDGPGGRLRLGVPPGPAAGGPDAGRTAAGGPAAPARAGAGRGAGPARGGRGRPRADLRLQPGAGRVRPRPAGRAAGQHSVAPGHAVRAGPARNRGGGLPPVPGRRVDRQLTQHRRRGRGAHRGLAGRLRAADHAARGQPGPGV